MTRRMRARPRGTAVQCGILGAAAVLASVVLALVPWTGASAHDYLVDSFPKANSVVTQPLSKVTLTFDDVVLNLSGDGSSALLQVTGPNGASRHFETGCPTIADRDVSAPIALGAPGRYVIAWQIVSADGHTVSSPPLIAFDYKPPAGTPEAKGATSRPSCGGATSSSNAAPATPSAPRNTPDAGELGIVLTIGGIIVALAIIGVVLVLLTGRRKPHGAARPPTPADHEADDE